MNKKGFQIGFAIALIILSVICTLWKNDILDSIIYAVVIPSFLLSIISFVLEISDYCKNHAEKLTTLAKENMELSDKLYAHNLEEYRAGKLDVEYVEGYVPTEVAEKHTSDTLRYATDILASQDVKTFFLRCQRVCSIITIIGYVLLILSLTLSYYAVKVLSMIDLNCITLWSMTLLYFTLELKTEVCVLVFGALFQKYLKKNSNTLDTEMTKIKKELDESEIEV